MPSVMMAEAELDLKAAWQQRRESGITAGLAFGDPCGWDAQPQQYCSASTGG